MPNYGAAAKVSFLIWKSEANAKPYRYIYQNEKIGSFIEDGVIEAEIWSKDVIWKKWKCKKEQKYNSSIKTGETYF